jgi:hypothetical protein
MDAALTILLVIIAVGLVGTWSYALWRGWRHASRDQTQAERRFAVSGLGLLLLLPIALAVLGASADTAKTFIAIGVAGVLPVLIIVGARDHRRRERRIRTRRHQPRGGNE